MHHFAHVVLRDAENLEIAKSMWAGDQKQKYI